jgi:cytohesin
MAKKKPRTLNAAVNAGDLESVLELIQQGQDLHKMNSGDGLTPLARAVNEQHAEIVKALLNAGANPNRGGVEVPLASAASLGNLELVDLLLKAGADPNHPGEDDETALQFATNAAVAERLLQAGAKCDAVDEDGHNVVLMHVGWCGREDVFTAIATKLSPEIVAAHRPFLEDGVKQRLRREDPRGTAIVLAAQAGKLETVQAMIAEGVDPDTPIAANGDTALARAVYFGNDDVVEYLLSVGANPNAANDGQDTPFHVAIHRSPPEMVRRLLQAGGHVNARNIDGKTPLELAVYYHRQDLIDLLTKAGTDPSATE